MRVLSNETGQVDRIYHISDIHIRLNSRRKEYEYVFEELYRFLASHVTKEDILVITGDILHSKIELQPECIIMTFEFLKRLSDILPTFMIAGNHDALLNNRHRIDSLTSILNGHTITNLYYLRETDRYRYRNIIFLVNSVLDEKEWIMGTKVKEKGIYQIGLYHGSLLGWRNVDGFQMTSHADKDIEDFKDMDFVLLGDIHKFQFMDREKRSIAYAGSLVSQNYGETDSYHGVLEWKLKTKKCIFHILKNPYRYEKIILRQKEGDHWIVYHSIAERELRLDDCVFAEYANVLICMEREWSDIECHLLQARLKQKYPKIKCQWKRTFLFQETMCSLSQKRTDKRGDTTEEEMIRVYLMDHVSCPVMREYIGREIEKKGRENRMRDQREWKIHCIRFQNLFGYFGEVNELKISDWKGKSIIGIFGKNSSGKSSLLDILCFLLFSKISRHTTNSIPKEILHFEAKKGFGEVIFEIGNQCYLLKKQIQRNRNGKMKIEETFFSMEKDGGHRELTEEQRRKTDKKIKEWIGDFRMFLFSNMSAQQGEISFRELKPTERKDFLYRMFDFDVFSILKKEKEDELRDLTVQISILRSHMGDFTEEMWEQNRIQWDEKNHQMVNRLQQIESQIHGCYQEILETQGRIVPIPYSSIEENERMMEKLRRQWDECNHKIMKHQERGEEETIIPEKELQIPMTMESSLFDRYSPLHSSCIRSVFEKVYEKIQKQIQNSKEIVTKWQRSKEQEQSVQEQMRQLKTEMGKMQRQTDSKRVKNLCVATHKEEWISIQRQIEEIQRSVWKEVQQKEWDVLWNRIQEYHKKWEKCETRFLWEKRMYDKDVHIVYNLQCEACTQNPHYKERKQQEESFHQTEKERNKWEETWMSLMGSVVGFFPELPRDESISNQYMYLERQQKGQHRKMTQLHLLFSKKKENERIYEEYEYQSKSMEFHQKEKQYQHVVQMNIEYEKEYQEFQESLQYYNTYLYIHQLWETWKVNRKEEIERGGGERYSYKELVEEKTQIEFEIRENDKYKEQWNRNQEYKREVKRKEMEYQGLLREKEEIQREMYLLERERESGERQRERWKECLEEWKEKEKGKKKLEVMIQCVDRNAIPSFLLQKNLEFVERRLNQMLGSFIDKRVIFRIEEKDILFGLEYHDEDGKPICSSFMGGMEGFIVDVCLKLCLSHLARYPCCNLFFIDEGISVFDQEHLHNIQILFDFLSQIRSHVFLISHLPSIQDFVDMSIEILRSKNKSQIVFS